METVKIELAQGERLERVLEEQGHADWHVVQQTGSVLRLFFINLDPRDADLHVCVEQQGPDCVTELYALGYLSGSAHLSLQTDVRHRVGQGRSRQVVKYVLNDHAQGEFYGRLYIAPQAQQTDAQQTNRNLLLSPEATMRTRPQLEIYADDVKAAHGATTGQLDESALFYMRQRGIDPAEARRMLLAAFLGEVVDALQDENMREQLHRRIEESL